MFKRKTIKQQDKETPHIHQCQKADQPTPALIGLSQVQH